MAPRDKCCTGHAAKNCCKGSMRHVARAPWDILQRLMGHVARAPWVWDMREGLGHVANTPWDMLRGLHVTYCEGSMGHVVRAPWDMLQGLNGTCCKDPWDML